MAVVAGVAALNLLARYGVDVIWKLHLDAATSRRDAQAGTEFLIEIAYAAEEWLRLINFEFGLPPIADQRLAPTIKPDAPAPTGDFGVIGGLSGPGALVAGINEPLLR
jgi:hypothetical protein